mmetsp:Transcript_43887/g.103816  ORF Transcript_43887/g.103816 Transcript_43887/m.103816 type:complete len:249 (-) Transcript_43887:61-807(-)
MPRHVVLDRAVLRNHVWNLDLDEFLLSEFVHRRLQPVHPAPRLGIVGLVAHRAFVVVIRRLQLLLRLVDLRATETSLDVPEVEFDGSSRIFDCLLRLAHVGASSGPVVVVDRQLLLGLGVGGILERQLDRLGKPLLGLCVLPLPEVLVPRLFAFLGFLLLLCLLVRAVDHRLIDARLELLRADGVWRVRMHFPEFFVVSGALLLLESRHELLVDVRVAVSFIITNLDVVPLGVLQGVREIGHFVFSRE